LKIEAGARPGTDGHEVRPPVSSGPGIDPLPSPGRTFSPGGTGCRPRLCECRNLSCRAEVWLTWSAYKKVQPHRVVSRGCVPNGATVYRWLNAGSAAVIA
jgi:hypothetical protein